MGAAILAAVLKFLAGPAVDRALAVLEKSTDLKAQVTIEQIRAAVAADRTLAEFNTAKLGHPVFWWIVAGFLAPLMAWWALICLDSIFYFPFDIANLPTPELRAMAADMVRWVFFVGSGVGALKLVTR